MDKNSAPSFFTAQFTHELFGIVRVLKTDDGEIWFVAKDVCDALELKNHRTSLASLDDDEKNTVHIVDGTPGNPNVSIINESGLYSLVLRSRKPEAKKFKKWVTSEVLPSIRKHGAGIFLLKNLRRFTIYQKSRFPPVGAVAALQ